MAAVAAVNKAKSQLELAQLQDKRAKDLFEGKAAPLKDYQQSQATLIGAQNDMRAAETALEASRNRLRILGFNDEAITNFQDKGPDQSRYQGVCPDRRDGRATQGGTRPVHQHRRRRSGVRDR